MIYINAATFIVAGYLCLMGHSHLLVVSFLSIILHEGAHAVSAFLCGYVPEEIELTPLGALMRISWDNITAWKQLMIVTAGPLMSLLLCAMAPICLKYNLMSYQSARYLYLCNSAVLLVNLLPCLPLDGGRLIRLLLSCFAPLKLTNRIMRITGIIFGNALNVIAVYLAATGNGLNLSLVMAGCLLVYTAHTATTNLTVQLIRRFMDRKIRISKKKVLPMKTFAVLGNCTVLHLLQMIPENKLAEFVILSEENMNTLGIVGENALISAALDKPCMTCHDILLDSSANAQHYS